MGWPLAAHQASLSLHLFLIFYFPSAENNHPLPGTGDHSTHSSCFGSQMSGQEMPHPTLVLVSPGCITEHDTIWYGISLWVVASYPGHGPSQPLAHPCPTGLCRIGGMGLERQPWCYASTAQQQPKHWCVTNTILATNTKHSIVMFTGSESKKSWLSDGICGKK